MSAELNRARHQQAIDDWNEGDFERNLEHIDENVVMRHLAGWPEPGPSVGIEEVRREYRRLFEVGGELEVLVGPFAVGDRTIARYRWPTPPVEGEFTMVITWRDGKQVMIEFFWDHDDALHAVGLEPEAP